MQACSLAARGWRYSVSLLLKNITEKTEKTKVESSASLSLCKLSIAGRYFIRHLFFILARILHLSGPQPRCPAGCMQTKRGLELVEKYIDLQRGDADDILFNSLLDACDKTRLDRLFCREN